MMRIALFLATNAAILVLISIVFQVFGIEGILDSNGVDLNLNALLVMSAVIGFSGSFISLAISKWSAKRGMGVHVIETASNQDEQWLVNTVQRQAEQAGIGMPEVGIFESPQPNAFATGMNRNNALVAVSTGLLQHMTKDEVEAVLAMGLMQGVVNTFVIFLSRIVGFLVDRIIFKTQRGVGPGYFITSIIAQIVLSILASTIVMWFSRWREFHADAGAAKLAGNHKMIAALKRLQTVNDPQDLPGEFSSFGVSGGVGGGLKSLFMSHPPLEKRIEALQASANVVNRQ